LYTLITIRRKNPNQTLISALQGIPEALSAHLHPFSSFFVFSTRDTATSFYGYLLGLFQSGRANMLRMSEVNEVDHQAMQHMLTEGCVNWGGFEQVARETDALLGGSESVLIFDKALLPRKARLRQALRDSGMADWARWIIVRLAYFPACVRVRWQV
jgi:hypothetical protein